MSAAPPAFEGLYVCVLGWLLAMVEVHVEGPNGWAEDLPTWRLEPAWLLRLTNGKPVTGYHIFLVGFLLAVYHLPLLFVGFSRAVEAEVISLYLLMAVCWDFQWFVWNPHWGLRRFLNERVYWLPRRLLRIPIEYYVGIGGSILAARLLDPPSWRHAGAVSAAACGAVLVSAGLAAARPAAPQAPSAPSPAGCHCSEERP
jgi:hypothetical protein